MQSINFSAGRQDLTGMTHAVVSTAGFLWRDSFLISLAGLLCAKNSHRIWNANREDWVGATERRPRVKNSRRNWNATEKIELEPRDKVHSPCCARSLRGISCDCIDFFLVDVLLYVNRNRRLIRDGEPRTATSTFTQLLGSVLISSTPGLCSLLQNLSFQLRAFSLQLHSSGAV